MARLRVGYAHRVKAWFTAFHQHKVGAHWLSMITHKYKANRHHKLMLTSKLLTLTTAWPRGTLAATCARQGGRGVGCEG